MFRVGGLRVRGGSTSRDFWDYWWGLQLLKDDCKTP